MSQKVVAIAITAPKLDSCYCDYLDRNYLHEGYWNQDPNQILKLFEQAGLPVSEEYMVTIDSMYNDPHGQMAQNNATVNQGSQSPNNPYLPTADIGGGPVFNNQVMGSPPMDNPIYDSMARDIRANPFKPTNYRQSTQNHDWNYGRDYE